VNGIDDIEWNPKLIPAFSNYSLETLVTAKRACKAALQHELGLPVRSEESVKDTLADFTFSMCWCGYSSGYISSSIIRG
jgi:hypothetical protein